MSQENKNLKVKKASRSMDGYTPISGWHALSYEAYSIRLILLVLLLTMFLSTSLLGQNASQNNVHVKLTARAYPDSVLLRWAPTTSKGWEYCNRYGFILERSTLMRNESILRRPEKIIIGNFKLLPLDEWEPLFKRNNKWAAIAAQAIYGKTFSLQDHSANIFHIANKVKESESRFSFALFSADLSPDVAKASGLWYCDKSVKENERYLYRVYPASEMNQIKFDTAFFYVGTKDYKELPVPVELSATFSDRKVIIKWNKEYLESVFTAYYIERSDDKGNTFKRVIDDPVIQAESHASKYFIYVDSLPVNYKTYFYRIRGVTPFGEISNPSGTVRGEGMQPLQEFPRITFHSELPDGTLAIRWSFAGEPELSGFIVERATSISGKYKALTKTPVSATTRQYVDKHPGESNYYKIIAVGKDNNVTASFPYLVQLRDSLPPQKPARPLGVVDSLGVVHLQWKANPDQDVAGYRVYRANFLNDEFTQISVSPVADTVFIDSISVRTLTEEIYYKITAIDHHANPSDFSEPVLLKRPDVIPPVAPVISDIAIKDKTVIIHWFRSASVDVTGYKLYKRMEGEAWVEMDIRAESPMTSYSDRDVIGNVVYEYKMTAIDDSKLESLPSQVVSIRVVDIEFRDRIQNVKAVVDRGNKNVMLSWRYDENEIEKYLIYRSLKGSPLRLFTSIPGNVNEFRDETLVVNTTYQYRIKASFKNGASSPLSEEIIVKY